MHHTHFLALIQAHLARVSIGPSTVRGQGPGVAKAGREFLSSLDLTQFQGLSETGFRTQLESTTLSLRTAMPKKTRSWGMARKMLNIFLRDALYSSQLSNAYELHKIELFLELPLDAVTSGYLRTSAGRGVLPRWLGVKHLVEGVSREYQEQASKAASELEIARVHLDAYWWGGRPAKSAA